jgi:hypothetical protein
MEAGLSWDWGLIWLGSGVQTKMEK